MVCGLSVSKSVKFRVGDGITKLIHPKQHWVSVSCAFDDLLRFSHSIRDVLIEKHFLGLTKRYVCELFWEEVQKFDAQKEVPPIITTENYYLINVRRSKLFFLSAVNRDVQPALIFEVSSTLALSFRGMYVTKDN